MGLKEKIIKALFGTLIKNEIEKSSKQMVSYISGKASPAVPEIDFEVFNQMYEQTSWVRAVVSVICKAVTARGYTLVPVRTGAEIKNAETLQEFFSNCNPNDTFLEILDDITRDVYVFGNAFLEVVYGPDNKPRELWNLDATSMYVKADEHGSILGYLQKPRYSNSQSDIEFTSKEVIHFKLGTKGSTMYGLSPLASLILPVTVDKYAQIYNRSFFVNGAKIRGAFIMKNATPEQVERNREYMKERARTPDMAHSDLVLEGDIEFKQISTTQKDMEFLQLREFTRNEILAVYGVPPSKVSIIETGNIGAGTGEHQTQTFYEETILPFQMRVAEKITKHIIRDGFGITDWAFQFNKRSIDEKAQAEVFNIYLQNGVFSPQEVRSIIAPRMPEIQKSFSFQKKNIKHPETIISIENRFITALKKLYTKIAVLIKSKLPFIKRENELELLAQYIDKNDIAKTIYSFYIEAALKGIESSGIEDANLSHSLNEKLKLKSEMLADDISKAMLDKLQEELKAGISANETIPQLMQRIDKWVGSQTITVKPVLDEEGNIIRSASTRFISQNVMTEIIARTEANTAYNEGNLDALKQSGITHVRWLLADDACHECISESEATDGSKLGKIVPLEEASGVLPLHPNCRCTWIAVNKED